MLSANHSHDALWARPRVKFAHIEVAHQRLLQSRKLHDDGAEDEERKEDA